MEITVHNQSEGRRGLGVQEYIGRPRSLGNPFVIGRDGKRGEVILKYRTWLWQQIQDGMKQERDGAPLNPVYQSLRRLQRQGQKDPVRLICHCKPQACHGDVIKAALEWLEKEHPV